MDGANDVRAMRTNDVSGQWYATGCHSTDCTCEDATSIREIDCDHRIWLSVRCPSNLEEEQCVDQRPDLLQCYYDGTPTVVSDGQCFNNVCDCTPSDECACCCETDVKMEEIDKFGVIYKKHHFYR